jgi:hypothetical protein
MNLISDVITYVRRIIKSPSNADITDDLIIDYINRFWIMDVDARMQLFDLKTKYSFQTSPTVDQYNMPLYSIQTEQGNQSIGMYPVYQGFASPAYINGIQVPLSTQKNSFFNIYPNIVQNLQAIAVGDGTSNYSFTLPILANSTSPANPPLQGILRGHVDMSGIIATGANQDPVFGSTINTSIPSTSIQPAVFITSMDTYGNNVVVTDSGQFLNNGNNQANYGLLMHPGAAPFGNSALSGGYTTALNTVNYITGDINVTFPTAIPTGQNISVQCFYFQTGLPRGILFYNNTLTLRSPPDKQYLVELDCYLTPAAFLNSSAALPFAYMAEYIARGAARKILADTGDIEQFQFYEPLFKEQEILVWKRSQRQWTNNRTETIYSNGFSQGMGNSGFGGGTL